VLAEVRMPLLKPAFLVDTVANHPLVRGSTDCRDLVDEAKNYHLIPERRAAMHAAHSPVFRVKERFCNGVPGQIYVVGGLNGSNPTTPSAVEVLTIFFYFLVFLLLFFITFFNFNHFYTFFNLISSITFFF
jgi:hypothetical protein